jgi:SAM-dependent methyltransferase
MWKGLRRFMTPARNDVNTMIRYFASLSDDFDKTLFVGVDRKCDYRDLFKDYSTLDIDLRKKPDFLADIQNTGLDERFDRIIMTGVYEFLDNPDLAIKEIYRLLEDDGMALICVPTKGYYKDKKTVELENIFNTLKPFKIREMLITWYKGVPNYIHCICRKNM